MIVDLIVVDTHVGTLRSRRYSPDQRTIVIDLATAWLGHDVPDPAWPELTEAITRIRRELADLTADTVSPDDR